MTNRPGFLSMDTAPKDGTRIRVKTAFGEDTARWHPNGLWVAGWAPIAFNDEGQPKAWRHQTPNDDAADHIKGIKERRKALAKLKNSNLFLEKMS